jgi:hypothetical protein
MVSRSGTHLPLAAGAAATAMIAAVAGTACHKKSPVVDSAPPVATASAQPLDHLAPDELVEGKEKAFALTLPLALHVEKAFMGAVWAGGEANMDKVANYIRSHVRGGTVTRGASGTVFDGVYVPAEPQRILHILVTRPPAGETCRIEVRDLTPAPPQPVPTTQAERYHAAGLTPDGKFLDPNHRE